MNAKSTENRVRNLFESVLILFTSAILITATAVLVLDYFTDKQSTETTLENINTHLSLKYPEKTFKILRVNEIDTKSHFQCIDVMDENGEIYTVTTFSDISGAEGLKYTMDSVQYVEINSAIIERFKEIFKLDDISRDDFNRDLMRRPVLVNQKFTGDNLYEVLSHTDFKDVKFYYNPANTDVDIESLPEEDKDFLDNFTIVLVTE